MRTLWGGWFCVNFRLRLGANSAAYIQISLIAKSFLKALKNLVESKNFFKSKEQISLRAKSFLKACFLKFVFFPHFLYNYPIRGDEINGIPV